MKIIVILIFVHLLKLKIASAIDIDDVVFGDSVLQDIREFMEIQKHTQQEEILVEHVARHLKTLVHDKRKPTADHLKRNVQSPTLFKRKKLFPSNNFKLNMNLLILTCRHLKVGMRLSCLKNSVAQLHDWFSENQKMWKSPMAESKFE